MERSLGKCRRLFDVQPNLLHQKCTFAAHSRVHAPCTPLHVCLAKDSIDLWPKLQSSVKLIVELSYQGYREVSTSHRLQPNGNSCSHWVPLHGMSGLTDDERLSQYQVLGSETNSTVQLSDMPQKLDKPQRLVVNPCTAMFVRARICLLLPQHCIILGCKGQSLFLGVSHCSNGCTTAA